MRGGRVIAETLRTLGITDLFTLPGAQTMALYDELRQAGGFRLHTSLHDSSVVGMADGFGRARETLTAVNLYEFAGFANATCHIYSALIDRRPMLVLGTLTDSRQSARGWSADVHDLMAFAGQVTKLALEVPRADRLEEYLRRAAEFALSPPFGPVYVGIPSNFYMEEVAGPLSRPGPEVRSQSAGLASADPAIERISQLIAGEDDVCLVAGAEVSESGGEEALVRLAERWALPVYMEAYAARFPMELTHPLNFGIASPAAPTFRSAKLLVAIGARMVKRFSYSLTEPIQPHQRLCHVHIDPAELGRVYPTEVTLMATGRSALEALYDALEAKRDPAAVARIQARGDRLSKAREAHLVARAQRCDGRDQQEPADAACVLRAIGQALRPDDVVIDELIGLRHWLPSYADLPKARNYHGTAAGFMGWGAATATGYAMAMTGSGKAVLLAGDGCFVMNPQVLWSAAQQRANVVFVVLNNRSWLCLKNYYDTVRAQTRVPTDEERIGCDLDDPPIDYLSLARGFGVPGAQVTRASDVDKAFADAFATQGPYLIDIVLAPPPEGQDYPKK